MSNPKVTLNEVAADTVAAPAISASGDVVIQDSKGRAFTLKKPSTLAQYRFVRFMGEVSDRYLSMVMPLIYITAIDGEPQAQPTSERQVDALIQILGEEGTDAVTVAVYTHFGTATSTDAEAVKK